MDKMQLEKLRNKISQKVFVLFALVVLFVLCILFVLHHLFQSENVMDYDELMTNPHPMTAIKNCEECIRNGNFRKAFLWANMAVRISIENDSENDSGFPTESYKMRGRCNCLLEKYDEAVEDYSAAINFSSNMNRKSEAKPFDLYFERAVAFYLLGKNRKAADDFISAVIYFSQQRDLSNEFTSYEAKEIFVSRSGYSIKSTFTSFNELGNFIADNSNNDSDSADKKSAIQAFEYIDRLCCPARPYPIPEQRPENGEEIPKSEKNERRF